MSVVEGLFEVEGDHEHDCESEKRERMKSEVRLVGARQERWEERRTESAVERRACIRPSPALAGGEVTECPRRDERRDDVTERPDGDFAIHEMDREHVDNRVQTRDLRCGGKESVQTSHRSKRLEVGGERATDLESQSEELRPEHDGQSTISTDEEYGDNTAGTEEEDGPVRSQVVDLACGRVELRG